jgi:hypothetical protein
MSALHPKADIRFTLRHVRLVPKADSCIAVCRLAFVARVAKKLQFYGPFDAELHARRHPGYFPA